MGMEGRVTGLGTEERGVKGGDVVHSNTTPSCLS